MNEYFATWFGVLIRAYVRLLVEAHRLARLLDAANRRLARGRGKGGGRGAGGAGGGGGGRGGPPPGAGRSGRIRGGG